MNYLSRIILFCFAANLNAQETGEPVQATAGDEQLAVEQSGDEQTADELPDELLPPPDEQTVPVATDVEAQPQDNSAELQELPDASDEQQLNFQYARYLSLMRDHVYDEADSVAKRVVELTLRVFGPKSTEFSKALINLAIVQHYTAQYGAAEQNFSFGNRNH